MSEKRITANHRNCKKSTGPVTPEGKAVSSMNAVKHGLRSNRAVFPGESSDLYDVFRKSIFALLEPDDLIHADFAGQIASALWRLRRASLIEDQLFTYSGNQVLSLPDSDPDTVLAQAWVEYDIHFSRLRRYQTSIERSVMAMLLKFQGLHGKKISPRSTYPGQRSKRLLECVRLLQKAGSGRSPADTSKIFGEQVSHIDDPYVYDAPESSSDGSESDDSERADTRTDKPSCKPEPESTLDSLCAAIHAKNVAEKAARKTASLRVAQPQGGEPSRQGGEPSRQGGEPSRPSAVSSEKSVPPPSTIPAPAMPSADSAKTIPAPTPEKPADSAPISAPVPAQTVSCNSLSQEELAAKKEAEYLDWLRLANARRERQEMEKGRF